MLQEHFEPFIEHYPRGCVFQQDNAAAHSAKFTKEYFMEAEITAMEWPARSPDLNCIENAWANWLAVCMLMLDSLTQLTTSKKPYFMNGKNLT